MIKILILIYYILKIQFFHYFKFLSLFYFTKLSLLIIFDVFRYLKIKCNLYEMIQNISE